MSGKIQVRLAVLSALAALMALIAGALTAQADTVRLLRLDVIPATTTAETPTDFTAAVANDLSSTKELGYVQVDLPSFESLDSVSPEVTTHTLGEDGVPFTDDDGDLEKRWNLSSVGELFFVVVAESSADKLNPGEYVKVTFTATPPNNTDGDTIHDIEATGKQSNDDNESGNAPGNTFSEAVYDRDGTFEFRNGDGTTDFITLQTDEVLVTGTAVDCSATTDLCTGTQTQFATTITVTADCGDAGILVVDTQLQDPTQIGAAAFYNALDGCSNLLDKQATEFGSQHIVTVDVVFDDDLVDSKGSLEFVADYEGDIESIDPNYVGDGEPLPDCKKDIVVNCVEFIKGGSGIVQAQVKMLLTDPSLIGFG